MAPDLVTRVVDIYHELCMDTDPRISEWPFIQDPKIPLALMTAYMLFLYLGPKWMARREPINLKLVLIVYNFSMSIFSAYIAYQMLMGGWLFDYTLGCQPVDYSNSPQGLQMAWGIWLFFIAKFIELLDTVFFILRKKDNQVTFLHVFHHGCLPMFWWWGVKKVPGGFGTFHALINCLVHLVMYFYYGMSALGPSVQKYLWWKRYVTVFQLAQFFIVTIHNSQFLFMDCDYPARYVVAIQGFTTIVAVLFLNFYIKTYKRPSQYSGEKSASTNGTGMNKHVANGSARIQNGYSKNNVANGYHEESKVLRRRTTLEK